MTHAAMFRFVNLYLFLTTQPIMIMKNKTFMLEQLNFLE